MKRLLFYSLLTIFMVSIASCLKQVTRVSPDKTIDITGKWNDTDSRLVADTMINQLLLDKWVSNYMNSHEGKRPIIIVGLVKNKSYEHIDAETFIGDIEKAIVKNGSVRLVQAGDKRNELRTERADQQDFASPATTKKWGKELGADFIMQGTINSIVDASSTEKVIFYQIDLQLTDLETNEVVWMGDKKIKKYVHN
jgi:penicillin-binding protein activator